MKKNKTQSLLEEILTDQDNIESNEASELLDFIENLGKELGEDFSKNKKKLKHKKNNKIEKIKRTYYLKKELINLLSLAETRCREIKNSRKDIKSMKVTKSKIVNLALELLLNDFVENGENSFLFQRLFSKHGEL